MSCFRLTILGSLVLLLSAQTGSASAFVRGAYYRLGDDDRGIPHLDLQGSPAVDQEPSLRANRIQASGDELGLLEGAGFSQGIHLRRGSIGPPAGIVEKIFYHHVVKVGTTAQA